MFLIEKSCQNCRKRYDLDFGLCKKLREERLKRDFWHKDFIKELSKLERELAKGCSEYGTTK